MNVIDNDLWASRYNTEATCYMQHNDNQVEDWAQVRVDSLYSAADDEGGGRYEAALFLDTIAGGNQASRGTV